MNAQWPATTHTIEHEVAAQAQQMPTHVARAAPILPPRFVDHGNLRLEHHLQAPVPEAPADVDVFHVHEEALVEAPQCPVDLTTEQHEHAAHPLDGHRRLETAVLGRPDTGHQPPCQASDRGKAPRAVRGVALDIHDTGSDDAAAGLVQRVEQEAEVQAVRADVGIQDQEQLTARHFEGPVVVGAKPARRQIPQHTDRQSGRGVDEAFVLWQVQREKQLDLASAPARKLQEQRSDEFALQVADD